ncbi:type 2 periplasmic-binding domain-containing protein [Paenibacillus cymbidii]|uniref:extracellular solute-binding protein n=1 Tax=Paenibacillus cymbidii TaxID=1639034 RepID=UPI00108161DD|nr:extracellular solute-binding protein [Paenibacillus cymbidii]
MEQKRAAGSKKATWGKRKQAWGLGVTVALALGLAAGCQNGGDSGKTNSGSEASAKASPSAGQTQSAAPSATPAKPLSLTYWAALNPNASSVVSNLNELAMYKEMEKRTNVKLQFKHPAANQVDEQFKLMIASHDLPDVIETNWVSYPGSPTKAIEDGVIIKLNDLIDANAPNLKKLLAQNPEANKQLRTDRGELYAFPSLTVSKNRVFSGLIVRRDWLDELKLPMPQTIADWETVLRAFKEKKGATAPFTFMYNQLGVVYGFLEAFGINNDFYVDNGKIKYGPAQPAFKQFLETFHRWYAEGLIDQDFATNDGKMLDANITNEKSGAILGFVGGTIGKYIDAMKAKNPQFKLAAAQYPVLNKGEEPKFVRREWDYNYTGGAVAITTANKNPAETVKYLDYLYGEEGHMLETFGVEGQTYTMKNGYPTYTDLIMNNPDKLPIASAMGKYFRANYPSPGYSDDRYMEQYYLYPEQKDALKVWAQYADNALKVLVPPVSTLPEEASEMARIMNELNTYKVEMTTKFIMGTESLAQFDNYTAQLKKMNVDRAIAIMQAALDRYNNRK